MTHFVRRTRNLRTTAITAGLLALIGVLLFFFAGCASEPIRPPIIWQADRIIHADPRQIDSLCKARGARGAGIEACYDPADNVMILPHKDQVSWGKYYELLFHEECHRLGWPADHPAVKPKTCQ